MENVSTLLSVQSSTLEGYIMLTIIHLARLENLQKKKPQQLTISPHLTPDP